MIGPIFFVLILAAAAVLPALAAWSLFRNRSQSLRLLATILGGQVLVTPAIALIAFSEDRTGDEDPVKTVLIYAGMALVFSIMTLAMREMVRIRNER